ncbi:MAG TPA: MFS transporter [Anaerolineales bacterium]|nr:MFS transporter [Anaerolineales bacterium]
MTQTLKRDQLTWLMYFMLAGLAYQQGILGPLMPFLRESLDMNYTQGGVLVTAIALGMILTGLTSERVAQRVGRRAMLWGGAVGFVIGSWALAFSPTFETAFAAVLFNSVAGAMTMATVNATLSDHHGPLRTSALAEANVAAALSSSASPWLIGLFQSSGLGWQWSLLVTLGIIVAIAAVYGRVPIPDMPLPAHAPGAGARGLPIGFWVYWLVVIGVVAFEWCFVVWGADYLAAVVGLEPSLASALMGVYLGAMVIGRFVGSWLTRRWPPAIVLPAALVLALLGFPLFWTALTPSLAVIGLFIAGLGVANLFPVTIGIAVGQAAGLTNTATARVSLAVGIAIFAAPLVLGNLADRFSLQTAFAIVPVLGLTTLGLWGFAYARGWR